jgi:UDP-N-acetyl-D-mannosaminuronic acid dehydrogenase
MTDESTPDAEGQWEVRKIGVIGPGIVGTPMAALLAAAPDSKGTRPEVVVVQRNSPTSGWKVAAINRGESPIGGVEPGLDEVIAEAARAGRLRASHDYSSLSDADAILVCVQTDKSGLAPDYGPLFEALHGVAEALRHRPGGHVPVVIFESTLAPSSMTTVIRDYFASHGLIEGRDVLLGNSPNRVMPGRLLERVVQSDKLAGGLAPLTARRIQQLYGRIVRQGQVYTTNSLTAEIVKTLENAYRDVRIAFSAEIAHYCDDRDISFYQVRDAVNRRLTQQDDASGDARTIPSGGLLVPTVGVGGHCLPKDGILLWWRHLEAGADASRSLILEARRINDESPAACIRLAERAFGSLRSRSVALLGTAYRFDSEDTRNSPTLSLARELAERNCTVTLHDPYVRASDQNLSKFGLGDRFTNDIASAMGSAEVVFLCVAHGVYRSALPSALTGSRVRGVVDGCNFWNAIEAARAGVEYVGIGRGRTVPDPAFVDFVYEAFRVMERALANEVLELVEFLNATYAPDAFNRVEFGEVQRLARTCVTGCEIVDPGPIPAGPEYDGFVPRLTRGAARPDPAAVLKQDLRSGVKELRVS